MKKYEYILFDADGTLFDFEKSEKVALEKTLVEAGLGYSEELAKYYSDVNFELWKEFEEGKIDLVTLRTERFARYFKVIDCDLNPAQYAQKYIEYLSLGTYLIDGAKDICEHLYGKAILSIATNGIAEVQKSRLALSEINKYFDNLFISEEIGYPKPKHQYFDYIFKTLDIKDKDKVIIIGDSLSSDIKGGIDAGIDTCYFNPDVTAPKDMNVTYTIDDLAKLKDIIG